MQEYILDIVVPMEEQIEIKRRKKKATLKKFSRICSSQNDNDDESWYVVREI